MSQAERGIVAVVVEDHYVQTPAGIFARRGMGHPYSYWQQFLNTFDEVRPIARVSRQPRAEPGWQRADGPGVSFVAIRDHAGLGALARTLPHTLATMLRGLSGADCFFIRGGGPMSTVGWMCLRAQGLPYARQVVGRDGEAVGLALRDRPLLVRAGVAAAAEWLARRQIAGAACVAYVAPALAASYPAGRGAPVFHYSDVQLSAEVVTGPRADTGFSATPLKLVSVGRLSPEKGHAVLLDALARLDARGARAWTLELIGPGAETERLRQRAATLGVGERVAFAGELAWGPALFARLDAADLFVLPSLTEGLPRALLEAMSRGLPAVGTRVGGVPDLLSEADGALVAPGDPDALATAIAGFMDNRARLAACSARGFAVAERWHPAAMDAHKQAFMAALCARGRRKK